MRRGCVVAAIAGLLSVAPGFLFAQELEPLDESMLFGDTSSVIDSAVLVNNDVVATDIADERSVALSGDVTSVLVGSLRQGFFDGLQRDKSSMLPYVVNTLMLDVRMPQGVKAFGAAETYFAPVDTAVRLNLRELFIDFNFNRRVYVRTGKQVLQWGRCYLWNPTDLVNVEPAHFVPRIGSREGTYGIRVHVPIRTLANIYGFIDMNNLTHVDSLAMALKTEALIGPAEMAVAVWTKRGTKPVFGYDVSTSLWDFDIAGEIALMHSDRFVRQQAGVPDPFRIDYGNTWAPRACLSVGRSIDLLGVDDRLSVHGEFYYNHFGARENVLDGLSDLARMVVDSLGTQGMASMGAYESNNLSRYYVAFFSTLSRFVTSDFTLGFNGIANLIDGSAALSGVLTYTTLNNFTATLTTTGFVGGDEAEYTLAGERLQIQLASTVTF